MNCKKLFIALGLIFSIVLGMMPVNNKNVKAENEISYNMTFGSSIAFTQTMVISGDVTLTISKGVKVEAKKGIRVTPGNSLTIEGEGTLVATGQGDQAAIGAGGTSYVYGDITINGGTVTATGAHSSAGIGNGNARNSSVCGNISITGGTVTATGGYDATGIGNGRTGTSGYCSCGNITIENTVTRVTATKGGPATRSIGQYSHFNVGTCGTVTIGGEDKTPGVSPTSGNTYVYEP